MDLSQIPVSNVHRKRSTSSSSCLFYFGIFKINRLQFLKQLCACVCTKLLQSYLTLCSPPGFSVHGILQARILEWVAMPSFRGSSQLRDQTHVSCLLHWQMGSLPLSPPGKLRTVFVLHKNQAKSIQSSCITPHL